MASAGIVLLVVGVLLALSELHNPTHGVAGGSGVALMAVGIVLALAAAGSGIAIGLGAGVLLAGAGGGAIAYTVTRTAAVRRQRVRGGAEGLIGQVGVVRSWGGEDGSVSLEGAVWRARRSLEPDPVEEADERTLRTGDRVVVERLSGLTLSVRPAEAWELI